MKQKYLVSMIAVLAVLVGLIMLKQMTNKQPTIEQQTNLTPLVPNGVSKSDITKLEMFTGSKPDEKVVLQRDASDPNVWTVTSHFNAPGDKTKIEEFVDKVVALKGEIRESAKDDASLEPYRLGEKEAFHLAAYTKAQDKPAFSLLEGKAPNYDQVFVRSADAKDVYVLNVDIRREAGVYESAPPAKPGEKEKAPEPVAPKADNWVNKKVLEVDQAKLAKLEIQTPDKHLVFTKEKKEVPVDQAPATPGAPNGSFTIPMNSSGPTTMKLPEIKIGGPSAPAPAPAPKKDATPAPVVPAPAAPAPAAAKPNEKPAVPAPAPAPAAAEKKQSSAKMPEKSEELTEGDAPATPLTAAEKAADVNKPTAGKPADAGKPAMTDKPADAAAPGAPAKPATKTEEKWVLSAGGPGLGLKQTGIDNLVRAFTPLTATDVMDPAKLADWGLDKPTFTCTLTIDGDKEPTVIQGGRPDPNGDGYVKVGAGANATVYKIARYTFERIFPKGTDLFELGGLELNDADVTKMSVKQADKSFDVTKTGDAWTVDTPKAELKVQDSAIKSAASALAKWKAADYSDSADGKGLDAPAMSATITMKDGSTHTLALGAESKGIAGHYATLDGGKTVFVISKSDFDRTFIAPKDLYQHALLDITDEDIQKISVERKDDSFAVSHEGEKYTVNVGGAAKEGEHEKCLDFVSDVVKLQASDINFGKSGLPGAADATIRVTTKDGKDHVLQFGAVENDNYPLAVEGKSQAFSVAKTDVLAVLPASSTLVKAEPKPEPVPAASAPGAPAAPVAPAPTAGAAPAAPAMTPPAVPAAPESDKKLTAPTPAPATAPPAAPAATPPAVPAAPESDKKLSAPTPAPDKPATPAPATK